MSEPTHRQLASAPVLGPPQPPPKQWPILRHKTLQDFPLAAADVQIRSILTRLDKDPRPLSTVERAAITADLGTILGALMMYAETYHNELEAIRQAAETQKN